MDQALAFMGRPNLLSCFQRISSLQEKLQHLHDRFGFSNITGLIHSAQIDLQLLMENAAFTFEQLLHKAIQDNPDNAGSAVEKVKHRVLKQYDYDSSTARKRISQDALVSITLPFIKRNLAPTCKTGLQSLEQSIDSEHSNFLHVENVYESVLLQILDEEVTKGTVRHTDEDRKVVKEAVSLKKYNLFTDSRDLVSKSSRSSLSSPPVSTPGSPAMALASPAKASSEAQPPSPLVGNGVSPSPQKERSSGRDHDRDASGKVEQKESELSAIVQEVEPPAPAAEEVVQAVGAEAGVDLETATVAEMTAVNETQEENVAAAAPENASPEEVCVETEEVQTQSSEALEEAVEEALSVGDTLKTDAEEAAAQTEAPEPGPAPSAEETRSQAATSSEGDREGESSEVKLEAPSSGEAPVALQLEGHTAEPAPVSDPNSLDASVGSESPPSDVESTEEVKVTQSSEDDVSMTSDVLVDEANVSKSPVSSDDAPEDKSASEEASPQTQREGDTSRDVSVGGDIEAGASVNAEASTSPSSEETPSSPEARPPDCVKDIRDLVVEVIEVEELMQRYPSGVPKDE
ncbi:hypothetical protein INR49_006998 [Caranx melampygus]|nr:hypothetical protein INR49_006998 [Caranx melampygus]